MGLRCFVLGVICLSYTLGQGNLGGLTGRVTDSSGASVPDVSIQIHNLDTGQDSKAGTSSDGAFLASNLAPGLYRVVVSKTGFRTVRPRIRVGQHRDCNNGRLHALSWIHHRISHGLRQ